MATADNTPSLSAQLVGSGSAVYYQDGFRAVLEDYMTYLRNHSDTQIRAIEPHDLYVFRGDFGGLLLQMGIPLYMHWIIVRMNGYRCLVEIPADLTQILIPPEAELNRLQILYTTNLSQ